jgi:hypothetical protein
MKLAGRVVGIIAIAAALALAGCGKSQRTGGAPGATRAGVPLPEWAPKNPSPEFLRAAKVLKPQPDELQPSGAPPEIAAMASRIRSTYPAAYEFFGTLTDKQVGRFRATREIRIRAKMLTTIQRAALDRWFEGYRRAMTGAAGNLPVPEDYRVALYKEGATEDLSNVDVGFSTVPVGSAPATASTHRVSIWFWVKKPGGNVTQLGYPFAQM